VQVFHVPWSRRADLAEVRHAICDGIDALKRVVDPGFVGNRQRVQNRIGGTAQCHVQREGVVKRFDSDDVARTEVSLN
jgi:hypothetical protein